MKAIQHRPIEAEPPSITAWTDVAIAVAAFAIAFLVTLLILGGVP